MNVAIGVDHRGFAIKSDLSAAVVGEAVASGQADRGIIVCGSGVGACVAANKVAGVRAGMCHDTYSARQGVEHDDMNVLCLGSGIVGLSLIEELVDAFLGARFADGEERYVRRRHKVQALERGERLSP